MEYTSYEIQAKTLLSEDAALVEALLDTLYRGGGRCDAVLDESERYSLMAGGKRVRPALTLEFCRLFGGRVEDALPFAAAVEMIHTFSLIHDDLPCMDDDDLRRGRLTNHKVFGEAYALLAGDGLALDAFGMAASNDRVSPEARAQAVLLLSRAAGSEGMVRGQIMDMFGEQNTLTYEELFSLFQSKDIDLTALEASELDEASPYARNFAYSGGVTAAVTQIIKEKGLEDSFQLGTSLGRIFRDIPGFQEELDLHG